MGDFLILALLNRRLLLLALLSCVALTSAAQGQTTTQSTTRIPSPLDTLTLHENMNYLQFDAAHKTFGDYQHSHPDDPMGPVSNAAAYLFAEFDRLHVLESELFVNDDAFENRAKVVPDPNVRRLFDQDIARATTLANAALAKDPRNVNALFAEVFSGWSRW